MKTRTLVCLAAVIALALVTSGSGQTLAAPPAQRPRADFVAGRATGGISDIQLSAPDRDHMLPSSRAISSIHASPGITETVDTDTKRYPGTQVLRLPPLAEDTENDHKCETGNDIEIGSGSLEPGAIGGPDSFGYTFADSDQAGGPIFKFVDISGSGTPVALGYDEGAGPFPIGFSFPFYDQTKDEFYIASNGYLAFNNLDLLDYGNDCPILNAYDPDDIIALYWDDLDPSASDDLVYYDTLTPCPYTGHGSCLVVQYEDYHFPYGQTAGTFEALLFESGDILIQFQDAGDQTGYGSTTGIENSTHTAGLTYACNTSGTIQDGLAVLFSYPAGLRLRKTVDDTLPSPGQEITYTLVIKNLAEDNTAAVVSDTLPASLSFAAPVTLDPPQAGATLAQDAGDLPILASGLTILDGEIVSLTFPVAVDADARGVIVNSASVTSAEITEPEMGSIALTVIESCGIPGNPIVNCGFETGNLAGWVVQDIAEPTFPLQVGGAGVDLEYGAFVSDPTHGDYAVLHGFDGAGPGTIQLSQDVTLPDEHITLEFLYRAGWDMRSYGAGEKREFVVEVEPPGGGPYPWQSTTILTASPSTVVSDTGKRLGKVNLSDFAGQTVRLTFAWNVPERYSGPAFFQLDNVTVRTHEPPAFTTLPVLSATEDVTYTYHMAAADPNLVESVLFSAPTLPSWLELNDHRNGTATLSGVPSDADVGPHDVELQVENSLSMASTQSFVVTVENVNDPPAFTSTPVSSALKGHPYTYKVVVSDDDISDTLTITAPTLPAWLALTDHGDGTASLSGTPTTAGEYAVRLAVTDGTVEAAQAFSVTAYHTIMHLPTVYHNATSRPEHVTILAWTRYADVWEEYSNSISAIERYYKDFTISETMTLDATELQSALVDKDVFLIPEQEFESCDTLRSLGTAWSTVLTQFLQDGGTLIVLDYAWCGGSSYCLLVGAGLMDVAWTNCSYDTGSYRVHVVDPSHPLLKDVPTDFYGEDGTIHFSSTDGTEIVEETTAGASVVLAKDVGSGHLALIGFDYYAFNNDMARLLANAVQWR